MMLLNIKKHLFWIHESLFAPICPNLGAQVICEIELIWVQKEKHKEVRKRLMMKRFKSEADR
jgi:hypothetical protein